MKNSNDTIGNRTRVPHPYLVARLRMSGTPIPLYTFKGINKENSTSSLPFPISFHHVGPYVVLLIFIMFEL